MKAILIFPKNKVSLDLLIVRLCGDPLKTKMSNDLAKSSLMAAALNSLVAIVLRVLTFASNAFILRYVSR